MDMKFTVHRAHPSTISKVVKIDGHDVPAVIPVYEVEMVSTDPHSGTYTHRFVGKDVEAAKKLFVEGKVVTFKTV